MRKLPLLILLSVWINLPAQIQFQAHTVTENTNHTILDVKKSISGDIDNDGDNDIVVYTENGEVLYMLNNGSGQFSTPVSVIKKFNISNIAMADIDSDGDLDLCVYTTDREHSFGNINFYRNDGQANFTFSYSFADFYKTPDPTSPETSEPVLNVYTPIYFFDLENDGDLDMITSWDIYTNNGIGPQDMGMFHFNNHIYFVMGDINNDGNTDFVSFKNSYQNLNLRWTENNQNDQLYTWPQHSISFNTNATIQTINLADMDNDNDLDLIISYANGNTNKIIWKENDGTGNFTTEHTIDNQTANQIRVTDINGDNQMDLIVKTEFAVKYYLNSAQGTSFSELSIINDNISAIDVNDYNNDTYPDIFYFNNQTQTSYVLLNNGNGFDNPAQVTQTGYKASDIAVADINNDNQKELIFASKLPAKISRFSNLSQTSQEHIINDTIPTKLLAVADFDNDNDADIFSVTSGDVGFILTNDNNSFSLSQYFIMEGGWSPYYTYDYINIANLDNDNFPDIVTSYHHMEDAFLNDGQNFMYYQFAPIPTCDCGERDFTHPIVFDINNDGSQSVVYYDNWDRYLNLASLNGNWGNINLDIPQDGFVYDLDKIDWNNDGLTDILVATSTGLYVIENDGNYQFSNFHLIDQNKFHLIKTADIDDDGDMDIVAAGDQMPKLRWLENNGTGSFNNIHAIGNNNDEITKIIATDYDNDGDTDIFAASDYKGKVVFYENGLYSNINQLDMNKITVYPNPANDKINIRTEKDILLSKISIHSITGQNVIEFNPKQIQNSVDISNLSKGFYIIKLTDNQGKTGTFKLVKK